MTARKLAFAILLLTCGFATGMVLLGRMHQLEEATAQTQAPAAAQNAPAPAPAAPAATVATLPDFSRVAERTVPSVVNVSSVQYLRRRNSPALNDPVYQFFFGDGFPGGGQRRQAENSLGSGVIVSRDGYILTNNHVVTGERAGVPLSDVEITVTLSDKREMPARIIGVDAGTDLALLKVEGDNLPVVPWGDSTKLKVAEWVLAIGNPYQLSETVTLGIVSAVNRTNVGINMYEDFIQTDAAINPGNSGGALVNVRGELIGINTAIFSQSGGYQGIGFAVASHLAQQTMNDLQKYGQVRRGTITGIAVDALTTRLAQRLNAPSLRGAVVVETSARGRTPFQPGDIIVKFNNTEVVDPRQLVRLVGEASIGSTATVVVLRNGRQVDLKVPIEQQNPPRQQ